MDFPFQLQTAHILDGQLILLKRPSRPLGIVTVSQPILGDRRSNDGKDNDRGKKESVSGFFPPHPLHLLADGADRPSPFPNVTGSFEIIPAYGFEHIRVQETMIETPTSPARNIRLGWRNRIVLDI